MSDLKSPRLIILKGCAFLLIVILCAGILLQDSPTFRTALLLGLLIWSSARFYYFLFYVLEHYVDSSLKYAGILALLRELKERSHKVRSEYRHADSDRPPP